MLDESDFTYGPVWMFLSSVRMLSRAPLRLSLTVWEMPEPFVIVAVVPPAEPVVWLPVVAWPVVF